MHMPLNYKDLREELDEILLEIDVPRVYYYRLTDLKYYIMDCWVILEPKAQRALEIIDMIMPSSEKRCKIGETYETIS